MRPAQRRRRASESLSCYDQHPVSRLLHNRLCLEPDQASDLRAHDVRGGFLPASAEPVVGAGLDGGHPLGVHCRRGRIRFDDPALETARQPVALRSAGDLGIVGVRHLDRTFNRPGPGLSGASGPGLVFRKIPGCRVHHREGGGLGAKPQTLPLGARPWLPVPRLGRKRPLWHRKVRGIWRTWSQRSERGSQSIGHGHPDRRITVPGRSSRGSGRTPCGSAVCAQRTRHDHQPKWFPLPRGRRG